MFFRNFPRANRSGKLHFLPLLCWQFYSSLMPYAILTAMNQFVNSMAKANVGRLRPMFLQMCLPQLPDGQIISHRTACGNLTYKYISEYLCTNLESYNHANLEPSPENERAAFNWLRLSFYSGHSSISASCFVFIAVTAMFRNYCSNLHFHL